jgi:hypothetical protein
MISRSASPSHREAKVAGNVVAAFNVGIITDRRGGPTGNVMTAAVSMGAMRTPTLYHSITIKNAAVRKTAAKVEGIGLSESGDVLGMPHTSKQSQ